MADAHAHRKVLARSVPDTPVRDVLRQRLCHESLADETIIVAPTETCPAPMLLNSPNHALPARELPALATWPPLTGGDNTTVFDQGAHVPFEWNAMQA
jgi:hypothetical protein